MKPTYLIASMLIGITAALPVSAEQSGKDVYTKTCSVCHATGLAGSPTLIDSATALAMRAASLMRDFGTSMRVGELQD